MMIEPITTKFDEKAKDDPTNKVKTILGKIDPNQVRHKVFVGTDPRVWDVVFLQLANAGVSQETINEVYDDVRGGTINLEPNPLALHLLARYKLAELNGSDDTNSVLETLSNAFDVIGNHGEFLHHPSLETLEESNPDAYQALGILSLFSPEISETVQTTDTDDKGRLMAAANMAAKCVNAEVPLTDDNIKQIEGTLTGDIEVAHSASMPNKATSTPGGLPPVSNSSDADLDLGDIIPKSRKKPKPAKEEPPDPVAEEKPTVETPAPPMGTEPISVSSKPPVDIEPPATPQEIPPEVKPAEPPTPQVEPKPVAPPSPKAEPKPIVPPVPKVEPKPVVTPAAKAEPKPVVPSSPKVEPKPVMPPAPKAEAKPADSVAVSEEPVPTAPTGPEAPAAPAASDDLSGIVINETEPEEIPDDEKPASAELSVDSGDTDNDMDKGALPPGTPTAPARRINVPQQVLMEIYNHASSRDQIADALRQVEQDITDNTPNAQFLVRFVPGVTQEIIKDILVNRTASGRYINRSTGRTGDAIPHTNLTGGSTYTAAARTRALGPVEVPPGFAQENSSVMWDEPVITTMGYPFINFGAPEIHTILKDKDEKRVKQAYKKLKRQLKKVGLSDPIKVLKDFKNSVGVPCAINRLTIDSNDLLETGNANVLATVYPRATSTMQAAIGTIPLTRDFIVEMYKVLSPTKGAKIYMDTLGMTEDEYADTLNTEGRPPIYIFIPKEKLRFKKAPAGFIARLFTSNKKPTLVEAKIGTHSGGFVMPFKTTRILFTEV
jgi:hypothetical protein